jgi:hypothetical protein
MVIPSCAQRVLTALLQRCDAFLEKQPKGPRVDAEWTYWSAFGLSCGHVYNQAEEVA